MCDRPVAFSVEQCPYVVALVCHGGSVMLIGLRLEVSSDHQESPRDTCATRTSAYICSFAPGSWDLAVQRAVRARITRGPESGEGTARQRTGPPPQRGLPCTRRSSQHLCRQWKTTMLTTPDHARAGPRGRASLVGSRTFHPESIRQSRGQPSLGEEESTRAPWHYYKHCSPPEAT